MDKQKKASWYDTAKTYYKFTDSEKLYDSQEAFIKARRKREKIKQNRGD